MKKLFLIIWGLGLSSYSYSQCSNNILFIVDDSGSINSSERNAMRNSIQALADEIFILNPSAQIGLIQYGQPSNTSSSTPSYYLTLPPTINPTIVLENDPDGYYLNQDVLPNSINSMINDNLFSPGGEFENIDSIFIFTDAYVAEGCWSVLSNCNTCTVSAVSCGFDYLSDLSSSLGNIPISVFRVLDFGAGTASGIEQNGGVLIEQSSFVISDEQIDILTKSLVCLNASIEFSNTCLGDTTSFTIDSSDPIVSILWDFGDGNTSNEENPTHTYASEGTYTVTITFSSDTETITNVIDVIISDPPVISPVTNFVQCDDDINDGITTFDLTVKNPEALGSLTESEFSVSYYESLSDAENNINAIDTNYTNLLNNQEIFVSIYPSNNPGCFAITSFFLIVDLQPVANPVTDFMICDDASNDGIETFDLNIKYNEILGSQSSSDYGVLFFLNMDDAINHINEIPIIYDNTSNNQEIFVKIFNVDNLDCYEITRFLLIVNPLPVAYTVPDYVLCENQSQIVNLVQFNPVVLNGQASNLFNITYHYSQEDADMGINILNTNFQVQNITETIFIRISNSDNSECYDTTSFNINVYEFQFENETIITCPFREYVLDVTVSDSSATYEWDNGSTNPINTVTDFGTYFVNITIGTCTETKQIDLEEDVICFVPDAITPNGDGLNDFFEISWLNARNLIVYNRYGTQVYQKENYRNEWDGTSDQGDNLPTGTYFYIITKENNESITGWVYLVR